MHRATSFVWFQFLPLVLGVPASSSQSSCPTPVKGIRIVEPNDTSDKIARQIGLQSFENLKQYNPNFDLSNIFPSNTITLPYSAAIPPATWIAGTGDCTATLALTAVPPSSVASTSGTSQDVMVVTASSLAPASTTSQQPMAATASSMLPPSGNSQTSSTGSLPSTSPSALTNQGFENIEIGHVSKMCNSCFFSGGGQGNTASDDDTKVKISCVCKGNVAESPALNAVLSNTHGQILVNKIGRFLAKDHGCTNLAIDNFHMTAQCVDDASPPRRQELQFDIGSNFVAVCETYQCALFANI